MFAEKNTYRIYSKVENPKSGLNPKQRNEKKIILYIS